MKGAFASLMLLVVATSGVFAHESIPINAIRRLTFYKGRMTTGRRAPPMTQLKCKGGNACNYFTPETISCQNVGTNDRGQVQWKCEAQMEDLFRLGETTVSCEGYSHRGDRNVLKGSCGVFYTLHLTEKGKNKYLRRQHTPRQPPVRPSPRRTVQRSPPRQRTQHIDSRSEIQQEYWAWVMETVPAVLLALAIAMGMFLVCACCMTAAPELPSATTVGAAVAGVAAGVVASAAVNGRRRRRRVHHHHHHVSSYSEPSHTYSSWDYGSGSSYSHSSSSDSGGWGSSGGSSSYASDNNDNNDDGGSSTYTSSGYGGTELR